MACWSNQAWVTSAVANTSVQNALLLAHSVRHTQTNRKITAITSTNVSVENRRLLRQAFDQIFLIEETFEWQKAFDDAQAKAFALSLSMFDKCVFVSANCLFLENADKLFETNSNFLCRTNPQDGSHNLAVFLFKPEKDVCHSFDASSQRITEEYLSTWLKNQRAVWKVESFEDNFVVDFCLTSGKLQAGITHGRILHFGVSKQHDLGDIRTVLQGNNLGVHEKLIFTHWLRMKEKFEKNPESFYRNLNPTFSTSEPIAIVGMSCRYPGANTLEKFWNLLHAGEEGVREPPAFRWTKEHSLRVTAQEKKSQAGFLSVPVDEFDARFFGVSPKEAVYLDPQTRLLHEVMWESLEDAGIDPLSLYGTHAGIFTGSWMNDYKDIVAGSAEKDFFRTYMGNSIGAAAARLSFLLGLTGPSIATESGCSSAIVALDLAVKSLRNGESNLALAGGVNLLLHPFTSDIMEYVISPNGRCKTFDANADGFGRAEGCGVLVLKRLSDAMRDRDNIWAVIKGSAVSQEGLSRSLGTPTVQCEALAMQLALKDANITPDQVSFVETHGTGTQVGDPMEVAAIAKAYYSPNRKTPLVIGSVKTNVGHTESCSGITGIMKAVLALQHELIPEHRNLETLNPEIFLDSIPAMIPMEHVPWPKIKGQPRICGVSSFGITGTDGHVILEEAPDFELPKFTIGLKRPTHLIKISGKTNDALDELLSQYENRFYDLAGKGENDFADMAYSANVGRASFNHRAMLVASDYQQAAEILRDRKFLQGEVKDDFLGEICFLFTGQGSQYPGMAKTLYETSPVFRVSFDACDRMLRENYNLSIQDALWESDPNSKELSRTIYSQTSIFCVEYCLFKLWQSWGIHPDYVLGHSLGEFCAAVAAGVLTFEDALKLVAERSRLIDHLPRGSMLVIKASKPEVEKWMKIAKIDLGFAAVNYPEQTVVAGDTKTVAHFLAFLRGQGTKAIILEATHAFHSRHMDPMLDNYRRVAQTIKYGKGNGRTQYVSGMEGRIIDDLSEIGADYWVRHTREKVNFVDACAALKESGCTDFLEIGPQPVLSSFVMSNIEDVPLNCLPSLRRGTNDWETILASLGKLYLLGYQVDWKGYDEPYIREKVSLPFHPFNRKSFWVECSSNNAPIIHPLLGSQINNASAVKIFQNDLMPKSVPYLKDHCIGSRVIFPGAGFTEMCLSAGYCVANGHTETLEPPTLALRLENLRVDAPLELKEDKVCRFQVIVDLPEDTKDTSGFRVKIFHQNARSAEESGKWILHASSNFVPVASTKDCMKLWNPARIPEIISQVEPTPTESFYKRVDEAGLKFGENFRMLRRYWAVKQENCNIDCDEIVAEMELPKDWNKYLLHPLIIDAVFQTGILTAERYSTSKLKVPVTLGGLTLFTGLNSTKVNSGTMLYLHARKENEDYVLFITTNDPRQTPLAFVEKVELVETTVRNIESILELQSSQIPEAWDETWKVLPSPFTSQVALPQIESKYSEPDFLEKAREIGSDTPEVKTSYAQNKRLIYLHILNAFQQLGWKPEVGQELELNAVCTSLDIQPEFRKLVRFYFTVFQEDAGLLRSTGPVANETWVVTQAPPEAEQVTQEVKFLQSQLQATDSYSKIVTIQENIGKELSKVLSGKMSSLDLLFPTEECQQQYSADAYYQGYPGRNTVIRQAEHVIRTAMQISQKLNQKENGGKGVFRMLEVGSGTGSLAASLLAWLKEVWGDQFEFYYTDISQSFFAKAEQKFEEFRENIKFEVFNIEQSPLAQGIPLGYFDMVAGTDVLHATRNLEETFVHLRQTLRPGGFMCFTETVIPARDITFVFGLLEGYWRYEDFARRPHHCCADDQVWGQVMRKSGFKDFYSFKVYVDQFSCMAAVADERVEVDALIPRREDEKRNEKEWVVFVDGEGVNFEVGAKLTSYLVASGNKVVIALKEGTHGVLPRLEGHGSTEVVKFENEEDGKQIERLVGGGNVQGVIYAWGMAQRKKDQSMVAMPFLHICKALVALTKPPKLYVITQGVQAVTEDTVTSNPTAGSLFGMVKVLKNECFDVQVRCVDLEQGSAVEQQVKEVLFELAMHRGAKEQHRVQVAYRGGVRHEARLIKGVLPTKNDLLKLPPSTDKYHLKLPASRMIQDLEFEPLDVESVGVGEIEVKVKAFALNFRDIFTIIKPSKEFEKLNAVGLDFAGVVTQVGSKTNWKVGDRVFGANFKGGQLPSHFAIESRAVLGVPDTMTYEEAATLPAVFLTAYHCLINVAGMKKGDKVLIHTGSGGVGLAAIQLAKLVGAGIITTAGNPRKRDYLRSLGIKHVFKSRDTSYEQDILRVTNGKGVDIVLNSITGPGIKEATLRATAKNGRFVEMSKLSTWTPEEVKTMRPDVDYNIVDLTMVDQETSINILEHLNRFLNEGQMSSIPFVKFDALYIRQALQYFQKAKHIGKVVCSMPEVSTQQGQYKTKVPLFNAQSTYLITGGLGGIGFEVCKWMLAKRATDIVLAGRRPPALEIAEQIKSLQVKGKNIVVKLGDIGDAERCRRLITEVRQEMKPLRGVMHCAGVLRDNLYSNQTWDAFQATFNPKVRGTWNLHEMTKDLPLEHFVVYSSVTALMGTPGQANHAAANCFEDAFIHYRHSLGLSGLTINWGQWAQVGCATEISLSGVLPVSVKRMLNGLEVAMRSAKRQTCFIDFSSMSNFTVLCPFIKSYLDDRLLKQYTSSQAQSDHDLKSDKFWAEMDTASTKTEKVAVLSGYLKMILRAALRMDPDEKLSDTANLQELGVDSLMMIELKNSIQSLLGSRLNVTANMLKNCNTIQLISGAVVGKLMEEEGNDEDIPLEPLDSPQLLALLTKDSQLPEEVQVAPEAEAAVKASKIKTVLVTGATGQLGPYLVAEICKRHKSVEKILCLVRGVKDDNGALERVKTHLKALQLDDRITWENIEGVAGDVAMNDLGISEERYAELCKNVDAVIHCAAKNHMAEHLRPAPEAGKLTDCRSVNYLGTVNILKFACTGKVKHVFYASTMLSGTFGESKEDALPDSWPEPEVIQTIVDHKFPGMQTCKWICEMLMKQANQRGIPCKVFRFPWIAGDSQTGRVNVLSNPNILRFISFLKLGAIADLVIPATALPVDICAEVALNLFINDQAPNEIFNITHPKPNMEQDFVQVALEEFGKQLEIIDWREYSERLEDTRGLSSELKELYRTQKMMSFHFSNAAEFASKYTLAPDTYFSNRKVSSLIPNYGRNFPLTMETVTRDFKFAKGTGILEQFGL